MQSSPNPEFETFRLYSFRTTQFAKRAPRYSCSSAVSFFFQREIDKTRLKMSIRTCRDIRRTPEVVEEPPPRIPSRFYEPREPPREPPRVLEIPAESKEKLQQENGNDVTIPLHSPTNHTIVHPGKYQPYREVTKPFEMSDFYKYSTKFRKSKEANHMAVALASLGDGRSESNNPPVKSRPHQPIPLNTGQFYDSR